jgi:hypothetical protein
VSLLLLLLPPLLHAVGREAFGPGVMIGGGAATSLTEFNRRSTYSMPIER